MSAELFDVCSSSGTVICSRMTLREAENKIDNERRLGYGFGLFIKLHVEQEPFDASIYDCEDD